MILLRLGIEDETSRVVDCPVRDAVNGRRYETVYADLHDDQLEPLPGRILRLLKCRRRILDATADRL
jgi:hypothetical protein